MAHNGGSSTELQCRQQQQPEANSRTRAGWLNAAQRLPGLMVLHNIRRRTMPQLCAQVPMPRQLFSHCRHEKPWSVAALYPQLTHPPPWHFFKTLAGPLASGIAL